MREERYRKALERIEKMFSGEGTVRVEQCRMREIVREAFHPDEQCPQCKGVGEVPQIREENHGDCVNCESCGPWNNKCKLFKAYVDEFSKDICSEFVNRFPMQKCPSCAGIIPKKEESDPIEDKFEILDIRNKNE